MMEIVHILILRVVVSAVIRVAMIVTRAVAVPTAQQIVIWWNRLCTRGLPADVGERRLREIESDIAEQYRAEKAAGVPEDRIAANILARCARGMFADLSWRRRVLALPPSRPPESRSVVPPRTTLPPVGWMDDGSSNAGWIARRNYEERTRWMPAVAAQVAAAGGYELDWVPSPSASPAMKTDVSSGGTLMLEDPGRIARTEPRQGGSAA